LTDLWRLVLTVQKNIDNRELVSPSRQCSNTGVGFRHGILSKEQSNNTGELLHTPDRTPADFYLLPRQESALKELRFCDATDIIKNATDELKRLSPNCFQEYFQHLYSRLQKCIDEQSGCFEVK
jgi:hypothetical protein